MSGITTFVGMRKATEKERGLIWWLLDLYILGPYWTGAL